ncbi:MAG: SPOR domain-containing protein [Zoogloeaceae bacterium]|jgi:cell division protein FtsN|nr:SPOR domain-containing protein [Zoogloeaceae bacterium]
MNIFKRSNRGNSRQQGGTLLGFFLGLVLGVLLATAVVWYLSKLPAPFIPPAEEESLSASVRAPLALPGKPGDALPAAKPETAAPPAAPLPAPANAVPAPRLPAPIPQNSAERGGGHYLQAGSFSKPHEADNLKAKLAMRGVEAQVRQVMLQDKTFYRLILGPYQKIADANAARAELARVGVETLLIKEEGQ